MYRLPAEWLTGPWPTIDGEKRTRTRKGQRGGGERKGVGAALARVMASFLSVVARRSANKMKPDPPAWQTRYPLEDSDAVT